MTTKTDITLPPHPAAACYDHRGRMCFSLYQMDDYARAAVEADRQDRVLSDEEIMDAVMAYGKACAGTITATEREIRLHGIRALLSRYSNGQPAKPSNSGELGSRPGKSDQCGQPAASAEPPKRPYARSSTLGEYGIIPECDTQPATPASAQATIKDSKIVGETSAQDREDAHDIEAAAKTLAECMDYPWEPMPEKGREAMRKHAKRVIDAARAAKGE